MKKNLFLLLLLSMVAFVSCEKANDDIDMNLVVFTDENNNPIDILDFGYMPTNNDFLLKIKNNNRSSFYARIENHSLPSWISSVYPSACNIPKGGEQTYTIAINRERFREGQGEALLTVLGNFDMKKSLPILVFNAIPTIINGYVGIINSTSARLRGEITEVGEPACTERGFVYSTSAMPTIENGTKLTTSDLSEPKFSADITNLTPNKTYHARAYAINPIGTIYSDDVSFILSEDESIYDYKGLYVEGGASLFAQAQDIGEGDWYTVKSMCENSAIGGFDNWRLPSRDELLFLSENQDVFGEFIENGIYWGSTTHEVPNFRYAHNTDPSKKSGYNETHVVHKARCVRSSN